MKQTIVSLVVVDLHLDNFNPQKVCILRYIYLYSYLYCRRIDR
jgi:hypothetical protein